MSERKEGFGCGGLLRPACEVREFAASQAAAEKIFLPAKYDAYH